MRMLGRKKWEIGQLDVFKSRDAKGKTRSWSKHAAAGTEEQLTLLELLIGDS